MLRLTAFLVLTSSLAITSAQQQTSNGWVPITYEQVYRQTRDENQVLNSELKWNPTEQNNDIHSFRNDAIKVIEPTNVEHFAEDENNFDGHTDKQFKNCNTDCLNNTEDKSLRQAKALVGFKPKDESTLETTRNLPHTDIIYNDAPKKELFTPYAHNYEVTETSIEYSKNEIGPIEMSRQQNNEINKENATNEAIEKLRRILIKYGIRSDDQLNNYNLSRVNNRYRFKLGDFLLYGKEKYQIIPDTFLIKYGIYLPHKYGIGSSYRNFYGNLVFNNVDKNPLGMY